MQDEWRINEWMDIPLLESVQKRPDVLWKTSFEGWPLLASGNVSFREHHPFLNWGKRPKLFVQIFVQTLNTCFPSGVLEHWYISGRGACVICPNDNPRHWVSNDLPCVAAFHIPGGASTSCDPTGTGKLKARAYFEHIIPCIAFLCYLALYPFTVINHSHECNCMLSPVSPPRESLNLRVAVGNATRVTNEHSQIPLESTNISLFSKGYSRVLTVNTLALTRSKKKLLENKT